MIKIYHNTVNYSDNTRQVHHVDAT